MRNVEYYTTPNGKCPILEYYGTLDEESELPYATRMVDLLKEFGHTLRRPQAALLRDGIYELRFRINRNQHRILYFFFYQKAIILTHGFYKSKSAVDPIEIDRAIKYKKEYFSRHERQK